MTTDYYLFPDRREAVGRQGPLEGDRPGDGDELLRFLVEHDWHYPVLVVFREGDQARWSFSVVNPRRGRDEASD